MRRKLLVGLVALGLLLASVGSATAMPPPGGNRMAERIAAKYDVSVDEIEAWHAQGFGYGVIGKAYGLAEASGETVESLLDRHRAGEGWGDMAHSLGFKLMGGGFNVRVVPWQVRPSDAADETEESESGQGNGQGLGLGNGHGRDKKNK